jgi:hypothetical protein
LLIGSASAAISKKCGKLQNQRGLLDDVCRIQAFSASMRAGLRVQARVGDPKPLHWPPTDEVLIYDFRRILRTHIAVPDRLRINHHRRSVFALIQAA